MKPSSFQAGPWVRLIARDRYTVHLKAQPDLGPLSEAEIEILKDAHRLYEQTDKWKLCDLTHLLPEWHDPQGSAASIYPEDILKSLGKSPEEMEEARQLAAEENYLRQLLDVEPKWPPCLRGGKRGGMEYSWPLQNQSVELALAAMCHDAPLRPLCQRNSHDSHLTS
jgi:hypothetical protein